RLLRRHQRCSLQFAHLDPHRLPPFPWGTAYHFNASPSIHLGGLDAQTQRLLGCLLTVGFETAALSRADLPPWRRSAYHLIIDEFSQFSADVGRQWVVPAFVVKRVQ